MDLYWQIAITLLIIGFVIFLITTPFVMAESDFAEILGILSFIFFGGGLAMTIIRIVFELLKAIWTS